MTQEYFVESVSRGGELLQRYGFNELPIRLGRAYNNHIILDDPYTAAHHAVILRNDHGELVIRELHTQNGIIHRRKRTQELPLTGDTQVQIGHTHLRVRLQDHVVAEEVIDSTNHRWEGWLPAAVGLLLVVAQSIFSNWVGQTGKFEAFTYLTEGAALLTAILLWSGMWALVNRLFSGQTRFGRHLFIAACGMVVFELWSFFSAFLAYAFSLEFFTRYDTLINIVIFAWILFFHLLTVAPLRKKRLLGITVLVAAGGVCLSMINNYQSSGRIADELYMHELLPPQVRQSPDLSLDEFIRRASDMKPALDRAQQEDISIQNDKVVIPGTGISENDAKQKNAEAK